MPLTVSDNIYMNNYFMNPLTVSDHIFMNNYFMNTPNC